MGIERQAATPRTSWDDDRASASRREALLREGFALINLSGVHSDFDRIRVRQIAEEQAARLRRQARRDEQAQNEHYRR